MAWAPRKRSESIRSRSRVSGGVLPDPRGTASVRSRRSGNSSRTSSATQPSASRGSSSSSSTTGNLVRPAREGADLRAQPRGGDRADQRLAHPAAPVRERDVRADGDAVEVGHGAVAVVADGEAPAVAPDVVAQLVAVALDGHGGDLHAREAGADGLQAVQLGLALRAARREEGQRDRPALPELADVEDLAPPDLAGRADPGGPLPRLGGDVGVAVQRSERERHRERRHAPADGRAGRARMVRGERVDREVRDSEEERHPDEPRVARRARRARHRRLAAPAAGARRSRGRRSRGRASRGTVTPRSESTSTAGSTTSTPSSETVRSITVTQPKSRSIRMSETARTAKPAIAVVPEARTAAPVER